MAELGKPRWGMDMLTTTARGQVGPTQCLGSLDYDGSEPRPSPPELEELDDDQEVLHLGVLQVAPELLAILREAAALVEKRLRREKARRVVTRRGKVLGAAALF